MLLNEKYVSDEFRRGLGEFRQDLDFHFSESGIAVYAKPSEEFSVDFNGSEIFIEYKYKSEFYRSIAMLAANSEQPFKHRGNRYFKSFGVHHSTRPNVPNVTYLKKLLRKFALLGYSEFEMYMHSNYEIDNEPYFGYDQGKYTQKELKEIADYGEILGIKIIPCLETLAHQPELKRWCVYKSLYDWDDIFNVGNPKTYELLEKMIATCAKCFHSKTINLGMDEAYMLGHGQYFRENGLQPRIELFLNHLSKVVEIAKKYGYEEQIIWSDMLYTTYNNYWYWGPNQIPAEVVARIPKSVTLAYWDYYGTDNDHYNWCMKNHMATGCKVMFAAGVWNWNGTLTHNRFSMQILKMSLEYSKNNKIDNLLVTSWGQAPLITLLPSLTFVSRTAYGETTDEKMKNYFRVITGIDWDDFMLLDSPNYIDEDQCYVTPVADQVLYNDYFIGLFDSEVLEGKEIIWEKHATRLRAAQKKSGEYTSMYEKCITLCELCKCKYTLGLDTRRMYKNRDKKALSDLVENRYNKLIVLYEKYLQDRKKERKQLFKTIGFEREIAEIGAMIQRTKYCAETLSEFVNGEIDEIEELETELLDIKGSGKQFDHKNPDTSCGFKNVFSLSVWL